MRIAFRSGCRDSEKMPGVSKRRGIFLLTGTEIPPGSVRTDVMISSLLSPDDQVPFAVFILHTYNKKTAYPATVRTGDTVCSCGRGDGT